MPFGRFEACSAVAVWSHRSEIYVVLESEVMQASCQAVLVLVFRLHDKQSSVRW